MEVTESTNVPKQEEEKTVFSLLSKLNNKPATNHTNTKQQENDKVNQENDDILIFRRNSKTNQTTINKPLYLKLHKSSTSNTFIDRIKGKFENPEIHTKQKQRSIKTHSQIIPTYNSVIVHERRSLFLPDDRICNSTTTTSSSLNNRSDNLSIDEEYVTIIPRSESEESVTKIESELSIFTMEQNNKKSKGFRKLFSVFSNKEKKKNSNDEKIKQHCRNVNDNFHIETNNINRQALCRHTIGSGSSNTRPIESNFKRAERTNTTINSVPTNYDERQIEIRANHYNRTKQSFGNQDMYPCNFIRKPYLPTNNSNVTYINVPNVKKCIDTSSSVSTLASEKSNLYQIESHIVHAPFQNRTFDNSKRDTPPRLLETKQDVRLVNPKAYVPGSSPERSPLNLCVADNYANTVNSLEILNITDTVDNFNQKPNKKVMKPPASPSLEPSKLKLPSNRDIVPLSPRVRSPIPPDSISAEKIIATELLKGNKSPVPMKRDSIENVANQNDSKPEKESDYTINTNQRKNMNYSSSKPPPAPTLQQKYSNLQPQHESYGSTCKLGNDQLIYNSPWAANQYGPDRIITNVVVHTPAHRTPTPTNSFQNLTFSPMKPNLVRPSTPLDSRIPDSPSSTPQKQDIRRSVEAYYWKEIKKMKDKENYNLYMLQLQYGNLFPHLYAAESVNNIRRSRSLSPQTNRNGRRSLSLPREMRPPQQQQQMYQANAIPENRAVNHGLHPISVQQLQYQQQQRYFNRNTPERNTIDGTTMRNNKGTSRPIFKRGSLSSPPQPTIVDDSLKRKVSFSGSNNQNQGMYSWSAEKQLANKQKSIDNDEVFLSNAEYRQLCLSNLAKNSSKEEIYNKALYPVAQKQYAGKLPPQNENVLYGTRNQFITPENIYGRTQSNYAHNYIDDGLYRQPVDAIQSRALPRLTRHGSIQEPEAERNNRRNMSSRSSNYPNYNWSQSKQLPEKRSPFLRREIILQDEIYGQFGGYVDGINKPAISTQQTLSSTPRQVSVSNKVCDIYGQIHDATDNTNIQQTGVIMGQLNNTNNNYRLSTQQFQRNSRLTASANDMNRRLFTLHSDNLYGRIENDPRRYPNHQAPDRPLPAIPTQTVKRSDIMSDTESGSETTTSEIQLIMNNNNNNNNAKFDNRQNHNMLVK